jgi:ketosteroid isomerase-like protein
MSEENVEIVQRMYESFHGGDGETALGYYSPEVVIDASVRMDGGVRHGRKELAAIIGDWMAAFDDWRDEIEEVRDLGDRVLVTSTQRGTAKVTDIEVEARYATIYEVQEGFITKLTLYGDVAQALQAAGLSE